MTTYIYWLCTFIVVLSVFCFVGIKWKHWQGAVIFSLAVLLSSYGYYHFYLQQVLVRRWGGTMSVVVPEGQRHLQVTWKEDNLWIENYDPATNTCFFSEYSRGDVLQGNVIIKNCSPLMPTTSAPTR
jgi:hypothetical protein